jgi:hypothetical protein
MTNRLLTLTLGLLTPLLLALLTAATAAAQPPGETSQTPANLLTRQRDVVMVNGGAAAGQWGWRR